MNIKSKFMLICFWPFSNFFSIHYIITGTNFIVSLNTNTKCMIRTALLFFRKSKDTNILLRIM